ncbi:hypothetical protein FH972_021556 [Carpinus fangiana]|uniref:Cation/H+ exchanger transmembrane domain-containing protein n=1 Tax=Carpinus fangiana TaxID=176857 RepID=A0A5N6KQ17_9ROSI|nr:hypothetical protein FH972_021556 [Carpinus fangiana]
MATATVTELITRTITATSTASSTNRATPQGGILEGSDPSHYDPKNPIILFIIQAGIIIVFCRLLHWPLSKLRQPRVIAEVIGGILLGPSVMGRIPGFKNAIFPDASMPNLSLVANLGLVLFLFLVGLEVDLRFVRSNWKIALSVGFAGMALPFGLGCAIAWGLYHEFRDEPGTVHISFGVYMLFIGIAMAITAFPVLCRILTELKLLGTPVGVIVLSAGVGNDVVGWILLALCVALVNAGTGLTALWVLLTCLGYTLFLVFAIRPAFLWVLNRNRALQDGPSQSIVALTLLIALTSSFFTGVIGVHPIFGAFMAGLICPHDGGFAIKVTEKVEDLVSALFLPLYFALSGLSTNIGLLDNGITWAYVVGVIAVAFIAKVVGGSGAARLNGLVWRECFTIGALMSCKGLVELIVLNIGLQARILSTRVFTIFVVMALVTTFATTPLVAALYPPWYQKKLEAWKRGEIDWDSGRPLDNDSDDGTDDGVRTEKAEASPTQKMLVYLRLDSMPALLAFLTVLGSAKQEGNTSRPSVLSGQPSSSESVARRKPERPLEVHGVRLLELTERESSVMKVSEVEEYSLFDPVVNTFRTIGRLLSIVVSGEVSVVPEVYYADTLSTRAREMSSEMVLVPWSETGSMSESQVAPAKSTRTRLASTPYREFVKDVLHEVECSVAVFVNNGFGGAVQHNPRRLSRTISMMSTHSQHDNSRQQMVNQSHRIFVGFLGGRDDRLAVRFGLQLAKDPRVTLTIAHLKLEQSTEDVDIATATSPVTSSPPPAEGTSQATAVTATVGSHAHELHASFLAALKSSLSAEMAARVTVESVSCTSGWKEELVSQAKKCVAPKAKNAGDLMIVGHNQMGTESCLGPAGDALMQSSELEASMLVVRAGQRSRE